LAIAHQGERTRSGIFIDQNLYSGVVVFPSNGVPPACAIGSLATSRPDCRVNGRLQAYNPFFGEGGGA
jgi:hypothetical protein